MSEISKDSELPGQETDSNSKANHRPHRILRRKRTLLSTINYRLDRMLRTRNVFRSGSVLLLLGGFLLVSHNNDVLSPNDRESYPVSSAGYRITKDDLTTSESGILAQDSETLAPARMEPEVNDHRSSVETANVSATLTAPQVPNKLTEAEIQLPMPSSDSVVSSSTVSASATEATKVSAEDEAMTLAITASSEGGMKSDTYVVNEGGSLWRTGRRFINDDVLLDKLIDNLSDSGMNVRSVRPGVEFVVNDLGSNGLLVVVEQGGDTYETHIVRDGVSSSVRRQATEDNLPRTASLMK